MTCNDPPPGYQLTFAGMDFIARGSGALWWPARRTLIVADLHLGRSERYARRGGALLPPWDVPDTLEKLAAEVAALQPTRVLSLGDAFDDDEAGISLAPEARAMLGHLAQNREWVWVAGNHDPRPAGANLPGRSVLELMDEIAFRHSAGKGPDASGHLHPALRLAGRRWRCFAIGMDHLILPAFGIYTGGLDIRHPELRRLASGGLAICCSKSMFTVPIP